MFKLFINLLEIAEPRYGMADWMAQAKKIELKHTNNLGSVWKCSVWRHKNSTKEEGWKGKWD